MCLVADIAMVGHRLLWGAFHDDAFIVCASGRSVRIRQEPAHPEGLSTYCTANLQPVHKAGGGSMAISATDEETFILSDEIIDRILSFFPHPTITMRKPSKLVEPCRPLSMSSV